MILFDTHMWLWALTGDPRMPAVLRQAINESPTDFYLSPVSVWETLLLSQKGRIDFGAATPDLLRKVVSSSLYREAPLNHEIAILSRELDFHHEDPADRFLAATAVAYGLTLATVDERLTRLPWLKTVSS